MTPELLSAFARRYKPPYWLVEDMLESADKTVRSELEVLVAAVDQVALDQLSHDERAVANVSFRSADPELNARLLVLAKEIDAKLERLRRKLLDAGAESAVLPPYDHPALRGVRVDEDGLVALTEFELEGDALVRNGFSFFVLPPVPASNANYWWLQALQELRLSAVARVRLDPLLFGSSEQLHGGFYRMLVYGQPFDWERIGTLRETEHGRWAPGRLSRESLFTDYAWIPHASEVDFVCEELPLLRDANVRGARYFHAIYKKQDGCVTHLDGAVRYYEHRELEERSGVHVRQAGKVGVRVKVFRIDASMAPDVVCQLAPTFFVWNWDVARYFGAPIHPDL